MKIALSRPWLTAELERPMRVLSWALNRPGFVMAERIVWREVRNADLPEDLDAGLWFQQELERTGYGEAIGFLTSRNIEHFTKARVTREGVSVEVLATVGLSNAVRIGGEIAPVQVAAGTINIAVTVSCGLSEAAQIEALSIATEARTAAVIAHGPDLADGRATGTGTDCIAIAAPPGKMTHAGLHTPVGQAIGAAVLDAVSRGVQDWIKERTERGT
ncbi:MAG: adenosylcobinamide amidohydrolase [Pseudomonadota bacterium]